MPSSPTQFASEMQIASTPEQAQKHLSNMVSRKCTELLGCTANNGTSIVSSSRQALDSVQKRLAVIRELLITERERTVRALGESRESLACKFQEATTAIGMSHNAGRLRSPVDPSMGASLMRFKTKTNGGTRKLRFPAKHHKHRNNARH